MFKEFKLNEDPSQSLDFYLKSGISLINKKIYSDQDLIELRDLIEQEFLIHKYPRTLYLDQIKSSILRRKLSNFITSQKLKIFFNNLQDILNCGEISLFPPGELMRNYFSGPHCRSHGWHPDCGGEYKYNYCKKILGSGKYIFGKLSIAFQNNSLYGGNIDIIPCSFKGLNKADRSARSRLSTALSSILIKAGIGSKKVPNIISDNWISDLPNILIGAKSVNPGPMNMMAFDHRVIQRGTPQTPKSWEELSSKFEDLSITNNSIPGEYNLKEFNKYMYYFQFASQEGLNSYIYDRSRRPGWEKEKSTWLNTIDQYNIFEIYFPNSIKMLEKALLTAS